MGQNADLWYKITHCIREMGSHMNEAEDGNLKPDRARYLKSQFGEVKKVAYYIYSNAYLLIQLLDGEQAQDPKLLWDYQLKLQRLSVGKGSYGEYSYENLHEVRHFYERIEKINAGVVKLSKEEKETIKEKLAAALKLAVELYFDAERMILKLD